MPNDACAIVIQMAHPAVQWAIAAACGCYVVGCGAKVALEAWMLAGVFRARLKLRRARDVAKWAASQR